jgi:hypothetical protein
MRWFAIALALVSFVLTAVCVGAAFVAIMPARGGESILSFAGLCLWLALGSGVLATALGGLALQRSTRGSTRTGALVGLVLGGMSLAASGGIGAIRLLLQASGDSMKQEAVEARTRHERALGASEAAAAHEMTSEALVAEWAADHDACDARHKNQVVEIAWAVGGTEWVDGATCSFLQNHGDIVCCLARGARAPEPGVVTFVGRYLGTDRRFSPPGKQYGKLVFEGCEIKR